MIALLTAMLAAAWVAAVAGAIALLGLARAVYLAILDLGANLTDCTPAPRRQRRKRSDAQ